MNLFQKFPPTKWNHLLHRICQKNKSFPQKNFRQIYLKKIFSPLLLSSSAEGALHYYTPNKLKDSQYEQYFHFALQQFKQVQVFSRQNLKI